MGAISRAGWITRCTPVTASWSCPARPGAEYARARLQRQGAARRPVQRWRMGGGAGGGRPAGIRRGHRARDLSAVPRVLWGGKTRAPQIGDAEDMLELVW